MRSASIMTSAGTTLAIVENNRTPMPAIDEYAVTTSSMSDAMDVCVACKHSNASIQM